MERDEDTERLRDALRPAGRKDAFLVLGAGTVQYRKGIDLFIATAAAVRRMNSETPIRFIWIGDGFNPEGDLAFSAYLADQIGRSSLEGSVTILDAVADLGPAYEAADVFFMSSRLDPQPNVGIDALISGIPTVCFEGACGTGEVLAADVATQRLVVPYLDVQKAAELILELASDPGSNQELRQNVERVGREAFDMGRYASMLDDFGRRAALKESRADVVELADSGLLDHDMLCDPGRLIVDNEELATFAMRQWSLWNMLDVTSVSTPMRRPVKGFHPQAYAHAYLDMNSGSDVNPVLHWLRNGRPLGPWIHKVYSPSSAPKCNQSMQAFKIALHGHFYYVDDAPDLAIRLSQNSLTCDLFLTTGSERDRDHLQKIFHRHNGFVDVRIVPNRGRDIGPFLTELALELSGDEYDLIGHVHGKKTKVVGGGIGDHWRRFLWENLIGGQYPMLDMAAAVFAGDAKTGLLIAEDPHLVGWDENLGVASELAERMGLSLPLDTYFDFPLGTMFWARPSALRPLFGLGLNWDDYPEEPVPYDGTVLHAIERLIPFVARHVGYRMAGLHVAGTTW
nr:rhamnan synthesis F family protein [Aureimonas altamirensis]